MEMFAMDSSSFRISMLTPMAASRTKRGQEQGHSEEAKPL